MSLNPIKINPTTLLTLIRLTSLIFPIFEHSITYSATFQKLGGRDVDLFEFKYKRRVPGVPTLKQIFSYV